MWIFVKFVPWRDLELFPMYSECGVTSTVAVRSKLAGRQANWRDRKHYHAVCYGDQVIQEAHLLLTCRAVLRVTD